ncbi:MAG: protein kinase, partial [Actinomycetota bacterium]
SRFIKLFRSEAHLAGKLDHPNVLTIHDWSADEDGVDGGAYIVTEYLTGGTLRQLLDREGVLSVDESVKIGLQVAQGLRAAHRAGLVHRDVKPGNLLFGADGRVRIGDFGIARAVAEAAWTEPEGHLIGTARYAAPEQGQAGEVNGRADIYSLAVCLTEMVTGEVPLVGESSLATMMIRRDEDLPVDEALGELGDLVGWAGMAEWAARPTADQLVDGLAAIHGVAGLDPVTMIDLTSSHPVEAAPVDGLAAVDLAAVDLDGRTRADDLGFDDPEGLDEAAAGSGLFDPEALDQPEVDPSHIGPGSPLSDHTADDYFTAVGPEGGDGRGRGRRPLLIGLVVLVLAAAGAAAAGWYVGEYQQGTTEVIEVALPSWPVPDFTGSTAEEAQALVEPYGWTVSVEERPTDGTVAGQLLEQSPPPGEVVGPGASVQLVYSLGPVAR